MDKPEIWAADYLSTRALKHFYFETNFFDYILHNWPINLSRNWKELLNYYKNLFVIASKRKEISRKNMLNSKLFKFPVSLYYEISDLKTSAG